MYEDQMNPQLGDVNTALSSEQTKYYKELEYFNHLHHKKHRNENQPREHHCAQLAHNMSSDSTHYSKLYNILYLNRFLPAGRVQSALGTVGREVSPFNCSVSQRIDDSMQSILAAHSNAAMVLRLGTGIGYNFSHLRPEFAEIKTLGVGSSGPLSFINMFDSMCGTIRSAGHRRGAQMAILNVEHPDIEKFVDAKLERGKFINFNFSVGITDEFMDAVQKDDMWGLKHNGKVYKEIRAGYLWEKIIRNAYASAEPGIINLSRLNSHNNLWYCEKIEATNPCSEQPLPPYGLCLLGSFNLPAYLYRENSQLTFDSAQFVKDIYNIVEAYDNIFDEAIYAIPEHKEEALNKRRMGLGLTGIANAIELMLNMPSYGNEEFCLILNEISHSLAVHTYKASIELAKKRGPFKFFDRDKYLSGDSFAAHLPSNIQEQIYKHGVRNSHLLSYAPCGTISQVARNVSSGVEPVFHYQMDRTVDLPEGKKEYTISDFAYREYNFKGKTLNDCSISDHLNVAEICQRNCDSSVSKTINVAENCSYREYEQVYLDGYKRGLKGLTVFRPTELRGAVIKAAQNALPLQDTHYDAPIQLVLPFNGSCVNGACER